MTRFIARVFAVGCFIIATNAFAENEKQAPVPKPIAKIVASYFEAESNEDAEAYQALFHVNARSNIAQRKIGWKINDAKATIIGLHLLYSDADKAIVEVDTNTEFKKGGITIDKSLLILRKDDGRWKVWVYSLLDSRKLG